MSEYFSWANIDKREFLDMGAFSGSLDIPSCCWVGNSDTDAVCTLLAGRWKGDTVAFLGDASTGYWPDDSVQALEYRERESPVFLDYAEDHFEDITGLFKRAKGLERRVFTDEGDFKEPYKGSFELDIVRYRYVVNHTKMLFYDRLKTPVRCVQPHRLGTDDRVVRFDPLPALLSKDSRIWVCCNHEDKRYEAGWVGDLIEPSDAAPPREYVDVSAFYDYWGPSLIADDGVVAHALESTKYKELAVSGIDQMEALRTMLPDYVIRGMIRRSDEPPAP